jgi:iron complex transport system ATP-binding protein
VTIDERALIDDLSLDLRPGELVGLVGPNGAGKTTLLRHLAGLRTPTSGRIALNGRELATWSAAERSRAIGYVPQHFEPAWDYTAREILALGASRSPGAGARMPDVAASYELAPLLDRRWSKLSGGERARTLLAAVLVAEPPVLLADEPGAGLDIRHRLDLLQRLRALAPGRILLVVMHELELAVRYCDRLIVLHRGRAALDGPARDVAADTALDEIFETRFQRVAIDPALGPLLPR